MTQGSSDWRPLAAVFIAIAATITGGLIYGRGVFFLVLAGSVLLGVIWIFWHSLQGLTGDAPLSLEEALGLTAPSAEEERKVAVLRALKDLEYERGLGKISEEDYRELSQKYRTEAKRLLQMVDEQLEPARRRAEALFEAHLKTLDSASPAAAAEPRSAVQPRESQPPAAAEGATADERTGSSKAAVAGASTPGENH